MDAQIAGKENLELRGGYLLACTHFSHVDPLLLGALHDRSVDWMTREEFFRFRPLGWLIRKLGGFRVNRFGVPVSAIRTGLARLEAERIVGIFPEGGVVEVEESVCRGGAMKQGVCLLSCRSGKPIIPCVLLGSEELSRVGPWLPFRRGKIWIAFGEPIYPPKGITSRKCARKLQAEELQRQFVTLYTLLSQTFEIKPPVQVK
jgi:1-acyl-sn-glycerol-3-phosphate acyltransferase